MVVDPQDHITAAAAIAAIGASFGDVFMTNPMDYSIASIARLRVNLQVINKHQASVWR
jgi:hypothetical protein